MPRRALEGVLRLKFTRCASRFSVTFTRSCRRYWNVLHFSVRLNQILEVTIRPCPAIDEAPMGYTATCRIRWRLMLDTMFRWSGAVRQASISSLAMIWCRRPRYLSCSRCRGDLLIPSPDDDSRSIGFNFICHLWLSASCASAPDQDSMISSRTQGASRNQRRFNDYMLQARFSDHLNAVSPFEPATLSHSPWKSSTLVSIKVSLAPSE
jgi:hypothetical protein